MRPLYTLSQDAIEACYALIDLRLKTNLPGHIPDDWLEALLKFGTENMQQLDPLGPRTIAAIVYAGCRAAEDEFNYRLTEQPPDPPD